MMTQIGEALGLGLIESSDLAMKCPWQAPAKAGDLTEEDEGHAKDDVNEMQANNGGILGDNLEAGGEAGWGASGTWNRLFPPRGRLPKRPRIDSEADPKLRVTISDHAQPGATRSYDWKAAAHHLIPGNAALKNSHLYSMFMVKGAKLETTGGTVKIRTNIGYNVNGNHNGAWLPGNYAIRAGATGVTWSAMPAAWCEEYMHAVVAKAVGQFHDAHTDYNENAKAALDTLAFGLALHIGGCTECREKQENKEIDPPWSIKNRLYTMSRMLRSKVVGRPARWKFPWFTSDRFKHCYKTGGVPTP